MLRSICKVSQSTHVSVFLWHWCCSHLSVMLLHSPPPPHPRNKHLMFLCRADQIQHSAGILGKSTTPALLSLPKVSPYVLCDELLGGAGAQSKPSATQNKGQEKSNDAKEKKGEQSNKAGDKKQEKQEKHGKQEKQEKSQEKNDKKDKKDKKEKKSGLRI